MLADRVKESSSTTGTGDFTLAGAPSTDFATFNSQFGTGFFFFYTIVDANNGAYETGRGYLSNSTTLVRERVYSSSNSNALVSFAAGTKTVFCSSPALLYESLLTMFPYTVTRSPGIYGGY